MSDQIFASPNIREIVNSIIHPVVREDFIAWAKKHSSHSLIFNEAAILFESGSDTLCDYIITVVSDLKTKVKRIIARDGISEQEILSRMKHQYDDDFKIKKSNFVIQNNNLKYTRSQVNTIYNILNNLKK